MAKTGLVLEGGGMRGIYTAGILDVFMERGLRFDGVIGVSAGAIHGASFMSSQAGRSIRYYKNYCSDPRFMSIKSLITTGDMVGVDFCYREIPDELDVYDHDAFAKNKEKTDFYVTCTDVLTGKPVYRLMSDMKKDIDWLRASATLPYISRLVDIDGGKYMDGGCSDSIPIKAFIKMGYARNVVVLTRPADYVRKPEQRFFAGIKYRKYPEFAKRLRVRHVKYNKTVKYIAELEEQGSIFVIRPDAPLDIGRLENDPENIQRVYDIGRADAEKYMSALLDWLGVEKTAEEKVFDLLCTIPRGMVVTYSQIAEQLGDRKLARWVGSVLHKNTDKEKYPCYKVVSAKGALSDSYAFGGAEAQKLMLEADGIEVNGYNVDLKKYQWKEISK